MATLTDMLFGSGTGAISPVTSAPVAAPPSPAPNPYIAPIQTFGSSEGLRWMPPLNWGGPTATGSYDMVPPTMSGARPVQTTSVRGMPPSSGEVTYYPGVGEARASRDLVQPYIPTLAGGNSNPLLAYASGRPSPAVAAIDGAIVPPKMASAPIVPPRRPSSEVTLPKMASATPGGLPFVTKYENALRTAALLRQVGLTDATGRPRPRATQEVTAQMKPRSLLDMLMGGKDGGWQKPGLLNLLMNGQTAMQMRPAPTRPESGYGSLGYTPSSSGQSNDYFTNARNGSVPDINYGISGSYSSGGARSLT